MKNQGICKGRLSLARKLLPIAATAAVALAAPSVAGATTDVDGSYDAVNDIVFVTLTGNGASDNVALSTPSSNVLSIAGDVQGFNDSYCTNGSPVVCTFNPGDYVVVDSYMGAGNDSLNGSGATLRDLHLQLDGESGSDTLTGSPFEDFLYTQDGEVDSASSSCGAGFDTLYRDLIDPIPGDCEVVSPPAPPPPPPPVVPSNAFSFGKFAGTKLSVAVPGAGVLSSGPAGPAAASVHAIASKKKKKKALVGIAKVTATAAGTYKLPVKLTSAGKKQLKKKKKLKTQVKVTFAPNGGTPLSKTVTVTFKKK